MNPSLRTAATTLLLGSVLASGNAVADGRSYHYDVTITNLTRGTSFTPILVASHGGDADLFALGGEPSDSLAMLAESGDTGPWQADLMAAGKLYDTASTGGLLEPGQSVTVSVTASRRYRHISLAGMLLPTNDGFVAVQDVRAPRGRHAVTLFSPGYDAGSEANDESCANIPGPLCGGEGYNASPGEGWSHIHAGIHGGGDLAPADYDWRNPVAQVVIQRVGGGDDH